MALQNFSDVQAFFNDFIAEHGISIATAPHGAFWQQVPDGWSLAGSVLVIIGGLLTVYQARQTEAEG